MQKPSPSNSVKKILVADDSLTIQKVIRLALSSDGYEIQTVSDGKDALEQASLFRPDICIIDVSLPQLDAYEVREALLEKPDLKNIPVILMSSTFESIDDERAEKLNFAGHLVKPFDPSHLRSTLLSVAEQTPVADPVEATINEPLESASWESGPSHAPIQHDHSEETIRLDPPSLSGLGENTDLPPLTDDLQELAKDTFEMSSAGQQEWGMIEPGKEVSSFDFNDHAQEPGHRSESENIDLPRQTISPSEIEGMVKVEVAKLMDQIHSQIEGQIEHELRSFTDSKITEIAEKVIKEEIHKLLSNPPTSS